MCTIQYCIGSHLLIKVAVQSPKHLKYCETWASAYQRIITDLPSHSGLYKRVKEDHRFEALKNVRTLQTIESYV